jgi:hypothetical protein
MSARVAACLLAFVALIFPARGASDARPNPVILISMDGFRWDY